MMTAQVRLELAMGIRRPETFEEVRYRDGFRKTNAAPGMGFPGLTREEMDMIVGPMVEVIGVESLLQFGKLAVSLICGHRLVCDHGLDRVEDFMPDAEGDNARVPCLSCVPPGARGDLGP